MQEQNMINFAELSIINLNQMLTAQQKAEAQKKLKNINEDLAYESELKSTVKKSTKIITETISALAEDKKKQLDQLKLINNQLLPSKILALDAINNTLVNLQEKLKNQKEKCNREAMLLLQEKQRFQSGIEEIKKTIFNIQKTVKESIEEETKKRKKIEDDLEKSLDDIRNKIAQFQKESTDFDKENAELKEKIDGMKSKLEGIESSFKVKADEKDDEVKKQRDELTEKLKVLETQVEKATELNKQFSTLQKKNFDNKLSLYLKTKKFPEFCSSFQTSAKTLDSCKEELLKGVTRLNIANDIIQYSQKMVAENNNSFLIELKKQKEKENRIQEIKKEKQSVRSRIIDLQAKIKTKKEIKA